MGTTNPTLEREKALAWIARQLRWERTLAELRTGRLDRVERPARQAA
jgi:hypothetical protein